MNIFVINCGSSSLKYNLIDLDRSETLISGQFSSIGRDCRHSYSLNQEKETASVSVKDHEEAVANLVDFLKNKGFITGDRALFQGIGHRVVHGGEDFTESMEITSEVKEAIGGLSHIAPLHNPINLRGIELCEKYFPSCRQVAVFDTAFHQTMPEKAYLYALPHEWYKEHGVRRYGFHGTSHYYVAMKAAQYLSRPLNRLNLITCHLGNGASICAIRDGVSVDTSMGFSPLEGLVMGTRSGDFDPAIMQHMMKTLNMDIDAFMDAVNKRSGLLGISGTTGDMRELEQSSREGDARARLAIQVFVYRVIKTIGAYAAVLGSVDAVVFTGGIGENSSLVRERVCQRLEFLGAHIDEDKNMDIRLSRELPVQDISYPHSRVRLLAVKTDEEWLIAHETRNIILGRRTIPPERIPIPIGISARHIHLSQEHCETLFGPGHTLTPIRDLSQPGEYVCEETLSVKGPKGTIHNVRILGPLRSKTQVEVSRTDEFTLGVSAPLKVSGDLKNTPGVTLVGPQGSVDIPEGVICAVRHIHMSPSDALSLRVEDGDLVRVRVDGPRELIFGDVVVRVNKKYRLEMHLDTDEANAAELSHGAWCTIVEIQKTRNIED